ncbi:hypothetical protein D3C84_772350 [compost metagenome]
MNHAEVLLAVHAVININDRTNLANVRRNFGQIDKNLLVIAVSIARKVVTGMDNGLAWALFIVESNDMMIIGQLRMLIQHKHGSVAIDVRLLLHAEETARLNRIPAETDRNLRQSRSAFRQVNLLTFHQTDRHSMLTSFPHISCITFCRASRTKALNFQPLAPTIL